MYLLPYCNFIQTHIRSTMAKGLVSSDGIDQKYHGTPSFTKGKWATLALGLGSLRTSTGSGLVALLSSDFELFFSESSLFNN